MYTVHYRQLFFKNQGLTDKDLFMIHNLSSKPKSQVLMNMYLIKEKIENFKFQINGDFILFLSFNSYERNGEKFY